MVEGIENRIENNDNDSLWDTASIKTNRYDRNHEYITSTTELSEDKEDDIVGVEGVKEYIDSVANGLDIDTSPFNDYIRGFDRNYQHGRVFDEIEEDDEEDYELPRIFGREIEDDDEGSFEDEEADEVDFKFLEKWDDQEIYDEIQTFLKKLSKKERLQRPDSVMNCLKQFEIYGGYSEKQRAFLEKYIVTVIWS